MPKGKKPSKSELMDDYRLLEKMSKELSSHQKKMLVIRNAIAKKVNADLKYGLIENLDVVMERMGKAQKELESARKELKRI